MEDSKESVQTLLDFKSALLTPINIVLDLRGAGEGRVGDVLARGEVVVLVEGR